MPKQLQQSFDVLTPPTRLVDHVVDVAVDTLHPLSRAQQVGRTTLAGVIGLVATIGSAFVVSTAASITMMLGYFGYRSVAGEERAASVFGNIDANRRDMDQRQRWIDRRNGFGPEGRFVDPAVSDRPFSVRAGNWLSETGSSGFDFMSASLNDGARALTPSGERPMSDGTARALAAASIVEATGGFLAGTGWMAFSIAGRTSVRRRDWRVHDVVQADGGAVGIQTRLSDSGGLQVTITNNTSVRWDGARIAITPYSASPGESRTMREINPGAGRDAGEKRGSLPRLEPGATGHAEESGRLLPRLEPGASHEVVVEVGDLGRSHRVTGVSVEIEGRSVEFRIGGDGVARLAGVSTTENPKTHESIDR